MTYQTWAQIKAKVKNDLDLNEETFISDTELLGYGNEAIDDIEADILGIYEDYFLDESTLPLVAGTSEYSLPATIYASKIRGLTYSNNGNIYPVKRLRMSREFEQIAEIRYLSSATQDYRYIIKNSTAAAGVKLVLLPPSRETGSNIVIWFLRNATRMVDDTSICDIPEFVNVVIQHIKTRCMEKEAHPNLPEAQARLEDLKKLMVDTLTGMVPDEDTEIEQDFSHYEELS